MLARWSEADVVPSADLLSLRVVLSKDIRLVEISPNYMDPLASAYDQTEVTLFNDWMSEWVFYSCAQSNIETLVINIAVASEWDHFRCPWRSLDGLLKWDGLPSLKKTSIRVMLYSADNALWQHVKDRITNSLPCMNRHGILEFSAVDVHGRVLTLPDH
jgi:hypothetical protein